MRTLIDSLKRQAKRLSKATGHPHSHVLDQLARERGFGNWSQLMKRQHAEHSHFSIDLNERCRMHNAQAVDLKMMGEWVAARGGPKTAWRVDLEAGEATLGRITLGFYETAGGGFELNGLAGIHVETEHDCELMEDGYVRIAQAYGARNLMHQSASHEPSLLKRKSLVLDDAYHNFDDPVQALGYARDSYGHNRADSILWAIRRCKEDSGTADFVFRLRSQFRIRVARDFSSHVPFLALLNDGEDLNSFFVMLGDCADSKRSVELRRLALLFCAELKTKLNVDVHPSFFVVERSFRKRPPPRTIRLPG